MKTTALTALVLAAGALTAAYAQASGEISGSVVDSAGSAIAGAAVTYENLPPTTLSPAGAPIFAGPRVNSGTRTDAGGAFRIVGLPPGTYLLCASGVKPGQLRSCEWAQLPTQVDLASGEAVTGLLLRIQNGVLLTFQVSDPNGLILELTDLPTVNGRLPLTGGNFRLGVLVGTRYVPAQLTSRSAAGRQYSVAVPSGSSARVMLDTTLPAQGVPSAPVIVTGQISIQVSVR